MSGLWFRHCRTRRAAPKVLVTAPDTVASGPSIWRPPLNIDLAPIVAYVAAHPWTVMALLLILGVLLPGVWSSRPERRAAAAELVDRLLTAIADIAEALIRIRRR